MKNNYRILAFLTFFPLIMVVIAFLLTPGALFPMQYGDNGEISRWGSKYELFIYSLIPLIIGVGMKIYLAKLRIKEEIANNNLARNEKIALTTSKAILLFFNIILFLLLFRGYFIATQKPFPFDFDIMKVSGIVMGIVFIAIGNYLPKSGYNSIFGIRTPWSVKNEIIWIKTQKGCGIILILTGIIEIIYSLLFLNGSSSGLYILVLTLFDLILIYCYSYLAYIHTSSRQ